LIKVLCILFYNLFTKFTWIKADLTFEGLKQIIYEVRDSK